MWTGPLCMHMFSRTIEATATEARYGPLPAPALLPDGSLSVTFVGTRTTRDGCDHAEIESFVGDYSFPAVHPFDRGELVGWDFDVTGEGPIWPVRRTASRGVSSRVCAYGDKGQESLESLA